MKSVIWLIGMAVAFLAIREFLQPSVREPHIWDEVYETPIPFSQAVYVQSDDIWTRKES